MPFFVLVCLLRVNLEFLEGYEHTVLMFPPPARALAINSVCLPCTACCATKFGLRCRSDLISTVDRIATAGETKDNSGNVLPVVGVLGQVLQAGAGDSRGAFSRLLDGFRVARRSGLSNRTDHGLQVRADLHTT